MSGERAFGWLLGICVGALILCGTALAVHGTLTLLLGRPL